MNIRKAPCFAAISLACLSMALAAAVGFCAEWSTPLVIDQRDGDYYASVVVDSDEDLHVAYLYVPQFGAPEIDYASNASGSWHTEKLEELPMLAGTRPDIAVNSDREPVIVYSAYSADPPKLAVFGGRFWDISDCPALEMQHGAPLVFVDRDDNIHVAFGYADKSIQYVWKTGIHWQRSIFQANAAEVTGIVVDSSRVPHITYLNREGKLMCATLTDGEWGTELVVSPTYGMLGLWDSLAIDDQDNMRLAYLDGTPPLKSELFYAEDSGQGWEIEPVEDGGIWAQVGVGRSYTAQIAHVQSYTQQDRTRYAFRDDVGWHSETIPLERHGQWSLASRMTVMATDSEYVHVVYSGEDTTNDGGNALLYIRGKQGKSLPDVSAELVLNDDSFKMHDTIVVSAHVVTGKHEVSVEAKVWVKCPNGENVSVLDLCSIFTIGPLADAIVPVYEYTFAGTEGPGQYEISARLIDPITGEEISLDSAPFHFSAF